MRPTASDAIASDRAHVKRFGFLEFVRRAWSTAYPGKVYRERWYHRTLCQEIDAFHARAVNDLAVAMPPSTYKSTYLSVFYPAYRFIDRAGEGQISVTYDDTLGRSWSRDAHRLMSSSWFVERWGGKVRVDRDLNGNRLPGGVIEFPTDRGGFLFTTTCPGGRLTGRHPGFRKIDDPIKPIRATVEGLATINAWYGSTFASRAEDQRKVQTLVAMQRLAKNDLIDHCVSNLDFRCLSLPAEYDPDNAHPSDPRTERGQSIDEERLDAEAIRRLRITLGHSFDAQYNQRPGKGGTTFDREDFKLYEEVPRSFDYGVLSLDCSFKDTATSDFVCGQAWGVKGPDFFLLDQFHDQLGFVDTLEAFGKLMQRNAWIYTRLVEDKANGSAVIDVVKRKFPGILPVDPIGGKIARANAISPLVRSGNVWLPRHAPWLAEFLAEVSEFPGSKKDDQVDAMSQGLAHLVNLGFGSTSLVYVDLDFLSGLYRGF